MKCVNTMIVHDDCKRGRQHRMNCFVLVSLSRQRMKSSWLSVIAIESKALIDIEHSAAWKIITMT